LSEQLKKKESQQRRDCPGQGDSSEYSAVSPEPPPGWVNREDEMPWPPVLSSLSLLQLLCVPML